MNYVFILESIILHTEIQLLTPSINEFCSPQKKNTKFVSLARGNYIKAHQMYISLHNAFIGCPQMLGTLPYETVTVHKPIGLHVKPGGPLVDEG
jgi:hypothetical protein